MTTNPLKIPLKVMSGWRTKARPAHEGIDLTAPVGTPVYSVKPGWVKLVTGNTGAAGNSIIVQHSATDETRYNHLESKPKFKNGDTIKEGQFLEHVGMTGRTTAPHLHFARYVLKNGRWVDVNPSTYLDFGGGSPAGTPTVTVNRAVKSIQKLVGAKQDGIYGPDTTAKVKAWQKKNGLVADGIWGPRSDAKGFPKPKPKPTPKPDVVTLKLGSRGTEVGRLQRKLKTNYPLYAGRLKVDNIFGPATEAAVKEFQRRAGLAVDGKVGPATRKRLGL